MSSTAYARLTRYAFLTVCHLAVVALVIVIGVPWGGLIIGLVSLVLLFAWGHFHADLALHPGLDERERLRWRVILYVVPWSMALYWLLHVRPRRLTD